MSDPFDLFDPYGSAASHSQPAAPPQQQQKQPSTYTQSSRQPQPHRQQALNVHERPGPVVPYSNTHTHTHSNHHTHTNTHSHSDDVDLLSHQYSQQTIAPSHAITYDDPFAALTGVSNSPVHPQAGVDFLDQLDLSSAPSKPSSQSASKPKAKAASASSSSSSSTAFAKTAPTSNPKAKPTPTPTAKKKRQQQHEEEEEEEEEQEQEEEEEGEGEGEPGEEDEMERKYQPRQTKASAVTKRPTSSAPARPTSAKTKAGALAPPPQSAAAVYAAQAKAPTPAKPTKHKQPQPEFSEDEASEEEQDEEEEEEEEGQEEEEVQEEEEEGEDGEEEAPQPVKKKPVKKPVTTTTTAKAATKPVAKPVKPAPSNGPAPTTVKVDVLAYMKRGSKFLKYGKYGYPHFRQFQLTDDNLKIVWFTHAKKLSESQVSILDIDEVRLGQTTPNFFKHQTPDLAPMSFSIMYQGGKKSLDLVASDPTDYKMWLEGLKMLIAKGEHGGAKEIKNARVAVTVTKKAAPSTSTTQHARPTGNHHLYQTVQKNFEALKAKFLKRTEQLKESKYYMSPVNSSMQAIVTKVHAQVKKIHELFQAHDYQACDDEIWKASLELETLKNMMRAVKT